MFKKIKFISAVTAMAMLSSCTFLDDRGDMSDMSTATEASTQTPSFSLEDIPVIGDSENISDDEDYSDTEYEETTEETTEKATSDEENAENPTESETEQATESVETAPPPPPTEPPKPDHEKAGCINVPYKSQLEYPTGCELVSASMLMEHYGFQIEPVEFIEKGYMNAVAVENKDGRRVGGNPNEVFVGDPKSSSGYGCYSGAIRNCLKKYLDDKMYDVYNLDGMSLSDICKLYIDFGEPVMIWATQDMKPLEKREDTKWTIEGTNEELEWLSNEHCMVLVGYDKNFYYFRDPKKDDFTAYSRSEAEKSYAEMGSMAVTVVPW